MDKKDFDKFNEGVVEEFRANGGHVGGMFKDFPMILVHNKGAKSGQLRISPLVYTKDGDNFVIIASKGGDPKHPDWYHNLVANPETTIEVGTDTVKVKAELTENPERKRLFDAQAAVMPNFKEYEAKAEREIPVFLLKPG